MSDTCTACGQPLTWVVTTTGKRGPINTEPAENGNVLILQPRGLGEKLGVTLSGKTLELARQRGLPLHLNHFASCISADDFRQVPE